MHRSSATTTAVGVVDSPDYVLWRKTLGQTGLTPFSGADGDGDGSVDADDYGVWRSHFGNLSAAAAGATNPPVESESADVTAGQGLADDPSTGPFTNVTASSGVGGIVTQQYQQTPNWWLSGEHLVDLDNDGDLDLFLDSHGGGNAIVALNDGHGVFTRVTTGNFPTTEIHEMVDINGDGKVDLATTYQDGGGQWWINNSTPGQRQLHGHQRHPRRQHVALAGAASTSTATARWTGCAPRRRDWSSTLATAPADSPRTA